MTAAVLVLGAITVLLKGAGALLPHPPEHLARRLAGLAPALLAALVWVELAGDDGVPNLDAKTGGVAAALMHIVPPFVAAALAVMLGALLTGAFHEDGLADVADAFAGGWTREDRLRILDDPLHGSYGVAALCGSIVLYVVRAPFAVCVVGGAAVAAAIRLLAG